MRSNTFLNRSQGNAGYAVFGKVIEGMDVVDKIQNVKTGSLPAIVMAGDKPMETTFRDVPLTEVIIQSVRRSESKK